jgi:hypothetical protein
MARTLLDTSSWWRFSTYYVRTSVPLGVETSKLNFVHTFDLTLLTLLSKRGRDHDELLDLTMLHRYSKRRVAPSVLRCTSEYSVPRHIFLGYVVKREESEWSKQF